MHYIASDIIKDLKTDENPEKYIHLPHTAFLFTSILLIAIGKTYNKQGKLYIFITINSCGRILILVCNNVKFMNLHEVAPPGRLITQVTSWIEACPSVCFIPPHSAVFGTEILYLLITLNYL